MPYIKRPRTRNSNININFPLLLQNLFILMIFLILLPVSCMYPIYDNTLERTIYELVNKKKSVIDTVMGDNINEEDILGEILLGL